MSGWKYIIPVTLLLVGLALLFRVWALNQLNLAFSDIDQAYDGLALSLAVTIPKIKAEEKNSSSTVTSFYQPKKNEVLYPGCNYKISWKSTSKVGFTNLALIDAQSKKQIEATVSGLSSTSTPAGSGSMSWEVGDILTGKYYLLASNVANKEAKFKSDTFYITKLPLQSDDETKDFCAEKTNNQTDPLPNPIPSI